MARMARVVIPGYPHHITQRGNRRQETFFCKNDYEVLEIWGHYTGFFLDGDFYRRRRVADQKG